MSTQIDLSGDGKVTKDVLAEGIGEETPANGCKVSCHYTGKLLDGTKFDSSLDRNEPFEFELGKGSVIKAFDMCMASMKKNEKCLLTAEASYAYGAGGSPPTIPPNATLQFELELLGWKGQDLSKNGDGGIERFIITKSDKKKTPNDGAHVKVHLVGKHEGKVFEERDVEFNIGEGSEFGIVEGVEIALEKFNQGEQSKLVLKPKYAFGSEGNKELNIPGNATVEYFVTLHEFEKEVESWKLDPEESLAQAKIFKDKGTNYFKQDKFKLALKFYEKCGNFLSNCDMKVEGEPKQVSLAVHLNKALCYQKTNDLDEVKHSCDEALLLDPNNIKALYRKGQAFFQLGELENALAEFTRVHELDKDNKAAINQITITKHKIKEYNDKQKKVYANMFSKFATQDHSKEKRQEYPDVMNSSKFGEWQQNERDHEMTNFEKENPDVLMLNGNCKEFENL